MTPLPMTVKTFCETAWLPALEILGLPDVPEAKLMGCAICLQESGLAVRKQYGNGPARGLPQFELGGGTTGVLRHSASKTLAAQLCKARGVKVEPKAAWSAMEFDDVLAAGFCRLLLLTDPRRLPALGDMGRLDVPTINNEPGAYPYYLTNWRPGKRHDKDWPGNYRTALAYVQSLEA